MVTAELKVDRVVKVVRVWRRASQRHLRHWDFRHFRVLLEKFRQFEGLKENERAGEVVVQR